MIPYSRPKLSDFYTLFESEFAENHTLHSGTYCTYKAHIWEYHPPPPGLIGNVQKINISSRGGQVLIQVQLIWSLPHCDNDEEKKNTTMTKKKILDLRASRVKMLINKESATIQFYNYSLQRLASLRCYHGDSNENVTKQHHVMRKKCPCPWVLNVSTQALLILYPLNFFDRACAIFQLFSNVNLL